MIKLIRQIVTGFYEALTLPYGNKASHWVMLAMLAILWILSFIMAKEGLHAIPQGGVMAEPLLPGWEGEMLLGLISAALLFNLVEGIRGLIQFVRIKRKAMATQ